MRYLTCFELEQANESLRKKISILIAHRVIEKERKISAVYTYCDQSKLFFFLSWGGGGLSVYIIQG